MYISMFVWQKKFIWFLIKVFVKNGYYFKNSGLRHNWELKFMSNFCNNSGTIKTGWVKLDKIVAGGC